MYTIVYKISIEIIQSWPGCDEMDASTANSCFRVPRTVKEDQSALVSVARPSGTKNKHKWMVEILREWQRTRTLKPPDLEVGNVSKITIFTTCVLSRTICCLVPRPHYCALPMRFGSRGPRKFLGRSSRIRHRNKLTEKKEGLKRRRTGTSQENLEDMDAFIVQLLAC